MKGKGLLACDESTGTVGTRLEANGMENTEANRMTWRNLLFTTKGIEQYISGAILFEETLFQKDYLFRKSAMASMDTKNLTEPGAEGIQIEPTLQQFVSNGLMALCKEKPKGLLAVRQLANWLLANNPNSPAVQEPVVTYEEETAAVPMTEGQTMVTSDGMAFTVEEPDVGE